MSVRSSEFNDSDGVLDLIERLSKRGVRLWSANGRLHYEAPKGMLSQAEIDELRSHKDRIVAMLQTEISAGTIAPETVSRSARNRAPLTFSQLARWNSAQLKERRSLHLIAVSVHLRGPADLDAIRRSIRELVHRHEALRTRIPVCEGVPIQLVDPKNGFDAEVVDLTKLMPHSQELEIGRIIDKHLEPIDVAVGPLFRARLVVIREEESMLLLAMDHIISDGASLRILLNEFFEMYTQITEKGEASLPAVTLQFPDYALWLRDAGESWMTTHCQYWEEHLKGCPRLRFPAGRNLAGVAQSGLGRVPFHFDRILTSKLRAWCRVNQTTIVMSVLTAYVALVLRWCGTSDAVFLYESDGRFSQAARSAVGYFTFPLYLRIRIAEDEEFMRLLNQVTDEYCNSYENADYCYLEANVVPTPAFIRNTCFNWVGQSFERAVSLGKTSVEYSWIPPRIGSFANELLPDTEPSVDFYETEFEIQGYVTFSLCRVAVDEMTRFAHRIPTFVEELLRQPRQRIKDISVL